MDKAKKAKAKPVAKKAAAKKAGSKVGVKSDAQFTVVELAKKLGIQETSARVALRKHGVKKDGMSYGWNSEKEFKAVVDKLQGKAA